MKQNTCPMIMIGLLAGLQYASAQVAFAPAVNYTVGSHPKCVIAAEVNADGKLDLICANNAANNTLTVLTNNGNGGFATAGTYTGGVDPESVTAADVNGDG